jgi:hypothetical protein
MLFTLRNCLTDIDNGPLLNMKYYGISGLMVSMLASSPNQVKPKIHIGICCFSAALKSKSKDWLPRNQDNVSKWGDMSTHVLLLQWASTIKNQLNMFV